MIKGPNKLGGELLVGFVSGTDRITKAWVYVERLGKREVNLPEDADLELKDTELIRIYLSIEAEDQERLKDLSSVSFYLRQDGKLCPFGKKLGAGYGERPKVNFEKVELEILPGSYYVGATTRKGEKIALGKIRIDKEEFKVYRVRLDAGGN